MSNSSIWLIDRTLLGATTPGQSEPGSNSNEGVLCIPQSFNITRASPSDCLVPYPGHSLGDSYSSVEMQSVFSTAPEDLAIKQSDYYLNECFKMTRTVLFKKKEKDN